MIAGQCRFFSSKIVAVDTETTGLNIGRDRLCVVQLSLAMIKRFVQFRAQEIHMICQI